MINKYIPSKFSTRPNLNAEQATEILMQFGIANTKKRTYELIREGRLRATKPKDSNPRDRRIPYEISEKALYDLIVTQIPFMREIFEHFYQEESKKKEASNRTKKVDKSTAEEPNL